MPFLSLLSCAALLLSPTWARALPPRALIPLPPASDPFYQPPAGFESTKPGTILRNRTIVPALFGLVPVPIEAYQLLYRTTAINGSAISSVTTIFKPQNAFTDRFIAYQTPYDSSNSACDPSYTYQELSSPYGSSSTDLLILQAYLTLGYIVSSSDYEVSLDAAFATGRLMGMVELDNMRAVSNFASVLNFSTPHPAIVANGYSGGSIATSWAASLQPSYAPELNIKGFASGGTPANLTGVTLYDDGTLQSGFLPIALDGLRKPAAYASVLNPYFDAILTPYGAAVMNADNAACSTTELTNFAFGSVLETSFQTQGPSMLVDSPLANVLNENNLATNASETPTAPMYVYHGLHDELIPYANISTAVDLWCSRGAAVNFTTYDAGGHITTAILGAPGVMDFIEAAFAGTVPTKGCERQATLQNALDPVALAVDLEPIAFALINELDLIGPLDQHLLANLTALVAIGTTLTRS